MKEIPILIGNELLKGQDVVKICLDAAVIITDTTVAKIYGAPLLKHLKKHKIDAHLYTFPAGERSKTRLTKQKIEDQMLKDGLGRDTTVITLGGGVVTDLGGYIAATYNRGVPLIACPTSLMGMVDASIGGKNGVNVKQGKNLIGTIYQPDAILIDVDTLKTLPQKEWDNGMVEMLKHGLIADKKAFAFLQKADLNDPEILIKAISDSCRIKTTVVQEDETETGLRRILNFGHTVGHAFEQATGYGISHGEAVALGVIIESDLSKTLGFLKEKEWKLIKQVFAPYAPKTLKRIPFQKLYAAMRHDKKASKRQPRCVVLQGVGSVEPFEGLYCTEINESLLEESILRICHDLYCH